MKKYILISLFVFFFMPLGMLSLVSHIAVHQILTENGSIEDHKEEWKMRKDARDTLRLASQMGYYGVNSDIMKLIIHPPRDKN